MRDQSHRHRRDQTQMYVDRNLAQARCEQQQQHFIPDRLPEWWQEAVLQLLVSVLTSAAESAVTTGRTRQFD